SSPARISRGRETFPGAPSSPGLFSFPTRFLALQLLLLVSLVSGQPGHAQPGADSEAADQQENDYHTLYYSAHLPIDRQLSQDLEQAERLLAEGRYSEGLPLL